MPDLIFKQDQMHDLGAMLDLEWLETNGRGGYASSSILDCHTRKYHGLLVCNLPNLEGKYVLLSKLETTVQLGDASFEFSMNQYPGVFHPTGHQFIEEISVGLFPTVVYRMGDLRLERSVMMPRGEPTTLVRYSLPKAGKPITLLLRPFLAFRDFHTVTKANGHTRLAAEPLPNGFSIALYEGMPRLYLTADRETTYNANSDWYHNLQYRQEERRGLDFQEDLFSPGTLSLTLNPGESAVIRASVDPPPRRQNTTSWQRELTRRQELLEQLPEEDDETLRLLKAKSEQLLVTNLRGESSIIAGYHWFVEWGRDTMIALPGLTLYCGRHQQAFDTLISYGRHERDGLIPNYLAIQGDQHAYNSVDASLWFCLAVQAYYQMANDQEQVRERLLPVIERILTAFADGRAPWVTPQDNGLIKVGDEHTQLTWMDAEAGGRPVTPRHGLAVELNALWYNALCFYLELTGETSGRFYNLRESCRTAYPSTFWLADRRYLADVVGDHGPDPAIRPNQIFAVSVPYSPLSQAQMQGVVQCVKKHLVTPYGLRSLSPEDPAYCPYYEGGSFERDSAYHQGTVWGWLTAPYVTAALRATPYPKQVASELRDTFDMLFEEHLRQAGLWSVSEIFDATWPHVAKGAVSQAWSVAAVIESQARIAAALDGD